MEQSRKGQQTINKTATGLVYRLGNYRGQWDTLTFGKNIVLLILMVVMVILIVKVFLTGAI